MFIGNLISKVNYFIYKIIYKNLNLVNKRLLKPIII